MITYHSIQDILELCEKEQMTFAQVIEHADMEERAVTQEASYAKMQSMYEAMRHADATYDAKLTSASGLVGGMVRNFAHITRQGRISAVTS